MMNKLVFFLTIICVGIGQAQVIDEKEELKFLALGDSYTIGQSVSENERWPNQLKESLEKEYNLTVEKIEIIAQTGWRTDNLLNAIADKQLKNEYDLVGLLIGVNNEFQSHPDAQYIKEFEELLKLAIQFAGGDKSKVFVISIPDYAYTPFGKGSKTVTKRINRYNIINDSITNKYKVDYHNITPISRKWKNRRSDLVASDGLHPSGSQYTLWVAEVMKKARLSVINGVNIRDKEASVLVNKIGNKIVNNDKSKLILADQKGKKITEFKRYLTWTKLPIGTYFVFNKNGDYQQIWLGGR